MSIENKLNKSNKNKSNKLANDGYSKIKIKKRNGDVVSFDLKKVEQSLIRSGASTKIIDNVLRELPPLLYDGITTRKIFSIVFNLVKSKEKHTASKFSLKSSIAKLGPKGHNFETFIAHILAERGYKTEFRCIINGKCIKHEIDVIAKKENETYIAECKFHNEPWIYSPIQSALYSYARYLDISHNWDDSEVKPMLITNTRFSIEVIKYAKCVNMKLLSWDYPKNESLKEIIDSKQLYPITILISLNKQLTEKLLDRNMVLIDDIDKLKSLELMEILGCSSRKALLILNEVANILRNKTEKSWKTKRVKN